MDNRSIINREAVRRYRERHLERTKEAVKSWRERNPDKVDAINERAKTKRDPRLIMLDSARKRARQLGREFDITVDDFTMPDVCPIFGTPFVKGTLQTATLDRIDSERGYVKGNVAVISKRANNLKSNGTADQHRRIAEWMIDQGVA